MCTPYAPVEDDDPGEPRMITTGYGYSMFTGEFGGQATYYHPGDNPGYLSFAGMLDLLRQLLPAALEP